MKVWLDDRRVEVSGAALLGQGGEAEVYDLGDGRALKLFKPPSHPDLVGQGDAQRAQAARLAEHQTKLPAFPRDLPDRVAAPIALARAHRRGDLVGYAMRAIRGDALYHLGEPRWRRDHPLDLATVTSALVDLGRTVARIHAAGVVIGDFHDLNVLVAGDRAWIIDADSFQYGAWRCHVFTERFVDPRLCDPATGAWLRPHDRDSDWFAFAAMALRSLLGVGPYGGVHQPADPARRVPPGQRARRGVSIYDPEVVAPRAALSVSVLPDALNAVFHEVFARGGRGGFPLARLDELRWRRCACGAEYAGARCPACRTAVAVPAAIHGALRATRIDPAALAPSSWPVGSAAAPGAPPVWLDGASLYRGLTAPAGAEIIGQVVAGHTHAWVGRRLGAGFYRAGAWMAGFVFRPDRRGLDDRVALPRLRGQLVDAHGVVGDDLAWLMWREALAGRHTITTTVVDAAGRVLASRTDEADAMPWGLAHGAVAAGPHLFVPGDAGVLRVSQAGAAITTTATFPATRDLVSSADQLHLGPCGLDVRTSDGALRLELPPTARTTP